MMLTATLIVSALFYTFMMFFGWIIASIGRARGWGMFSMSVFWPLWVLPEARRTGDPFLIGASVTLLALLVLVALQIFGG